MSNIKKKCQISRQISQVLEKKCQISDQIFFKQKIIVEFLLENAVKYGKALTLYPGENLITATLFKNPEKRAAAAGSYHLS